MSQIRNTDKTKWSWRPKTIRTSFATVSSKLKSHFEKSSERVTYHFSSVNQSCPTLCNPTQCSTPGFPVHHLLLELAQTHIQWCHPTISSSVIPFSSCLQSFLSSGSFQMSQSFTWGGQSIGVLALASVPPMNIEDWFSLGLTALFSLQSKELSRVFPNTTVQNHQLFGTQLFYYSPSLTSIHDYWKNNSID